MDRKKYQNKKTKQKYSIISSKKSKNTSSFWIFVFFFHITCHTAVLVWWQIKFNQNAVFTDFANLTVRNKNFGIFAENIPKIVVAGDHKSAYPSRLQFKNNVKNMTEFSPIYHVYDFFASQFQKRRLQQIHPFIQNNI